MTLRYKDNYSIPFATCLLSVQLSYSQIRLFSVKLGVIAGPVAYQSDFGVRSDFETNAGNVRVLVSVLFTLHELRLYRADRTVVHTTDNSYFR